MTRVPADVEVGTRLPELVEVPSHLQLFRYSCATSNLHRIHFDQGHARAEGHSDVLVQGHLQGALLIRLCVDWLGDPGRLLEFQVRLRRPAVPGEALRCSGEIVGVQDSGPSRAARVALRSTGEDGEVRATAEAVVKLDGAARDI